jgi:pantothenate synthetase
VRDAESLESLASVLTSAAQSGRDTRAVVLAAARLGKARLIDNLEFDWATDH